MTTVQTAQGRKDARRNGVSRLAISAATLAAATLMTQGSAQALNLLQNGSFEAPSIGSGNYTYPGQPWGTVSTPGATQSGWTYGGSALVNAQGSSAWYGSTPPSGMDGVQFAALQMGSTLSQSFTADATSLQLSWLAAGRPGMGNQSYNVLLNGVQVGGTFNTSSGDSSFSTQLLSLSGLTSGNSYELAFAGLSTGSDQSAFLDRVSVSSSFIVPPPAAPIVTLSSFGSPDALPGGQSLIANFNDPMNPTAVLQSGFSISLNNATVGWQEGNSSYSGTVYNDTTNYLTIPGGASATLTSALPLSDFSVYMGSPDTYNYIRFLGENYDRTLSGSQLTLNDTNQSWDWGKRVNFDFGGAYVNQIILSSNSNSFESDNWAATLPGATHLEAGVPEPASWVMMIMGFGLLGAALRRRRMVPVKA